MQTFFLIASVVAATFCHSVDATCHAQQTPVDKATNGDQDIESNPELQKAFKYHKVLAKRPNPGYLFDRFYNAWLDASSNEELGAYLQQQVEKTSATNDRLLLAFFHAKLGDDVAALEQFQEALKNDPGNAATLYEKAVVESRTLNFETALADLETAAKSNPSDDDATKIAQLRGKLLVRSRQTEEAVKVWNELLESNPQDVGLLEDTIEVLITEGLFDEANKWSDKLIAISKDPFQKVIRQLRKGDIYQRSGKRKKALEVYGDALGKVGVDSWLEREILGQIDNLFRREDNLVGLNEHFAGMIEQDQKRLAIRKAAARVLFELGQTDESIAAFQKVVELTPGDRANREALIALLVRAEENEKAAKQMQALAAQYPNDPELQIRLAELFHKDGKSAEAKTALEKSIQLANKSEYSFLRAARLFEKFSDTDSAAATYEKAIAAFPESVSAKESWATFLFRSKRSDEAVAVWKALAKDSDRAGLVRIARIASGRKLHQASMDMLLERYDDMKFDTIYLGQLCVEAIALKKFEAAIGWASDRVRLAKTSGEVDAALSPTVEIINSAGQTDQVIERLKSKTDRSASETCLLVEMLERAVLSDQADAALQQGMATISKLDDAEGMQILARQKVRLFVGRQDWTGAATAAQELLELPGARKSVNVRRLVELYVRSGNDKSALSWINEWKRLSPGSILPWLQESSLLERGGRYKESIGVLRAATRTFPEESDLFAQLAQKLINNGQSADAERIYWRQYDDSENLSDKLRWAEQLASIADDNGEMKALLEKLNQRRKNNPNSIGVLLSIAQAHRIADNYEERRAALLEATRIKKDSLPLLYEIARMEESEGDWEQAITTLERASLLDKTSRAKQKIARIYIEYGETKEGLARLLDIAGGANSSARDVEKIAGAIVETADWEQLRDFIGPQLERFETDYRLGFLQAIANEELGFRDEAKRQYLQLLRSTEEIRGLNQNKMRGYFARHFDEMREIMPLPALEFMKLVSYLPSTAYSYRPDPNRYGGYYPGGSGSAMSYLPSSLENCRSFAIVHLRSIALDGSEDEKKTLRGEMIRAGVGDVDLVLSDIDQQSFQSDPQAVLETVPDNRNALAIATMMGVSMGNVEQAAALKSYQAFKEDYPTLAFMAAMQLDLEDAENQKRFEAALEKVKSIEKPSAVLVQIMAQGLTKIAGAPDEETGLGKYRGELNELVAVWYSKMPTGQLSQWMFSQVVASLRQEESPKRLIELFDRELAKDPNKSKGNSVPFASYGLHSHSQQGIAVELPPFPPVAMISFPNEIYQQLGVANSDDNNQGFYSGYDPFGSGETAEMSEAQITESITTAKDPLLKSLLQIKLASTESATATDAKTICENLLKGDRKNVDAWYLSATLAASEKRWDDASDLFEKMRNLPMNAAVRKKIDGHLVAIATQGLIQNLEKEENKKVVSSAKSAALRLQRGRLSPEERQGLVAVLETLGLNEEAEKMESKIVASMNLGGGPAGYSAKAPTSRLEALADAGKSDAASRLLAQEFGGLAQSALNFQTISNVQYEVREFRQKLEKMDLTKELLEQLDPGESSSSRKLSTFAVATELFSDKEKSIELYKKLLKANPKEDVARLRLMMLELDKGESTFGEHFTNVNKRSQASFITAMLGSLQQRDHAGDEFIRLGNSVLQWLDTADVENQDVSWMSSLLNIASSQLRLEPNSYNYTTPSVYRILSTIEPEDDDKSRTAKKKREKLSKLAAAQRDLHDRIARKMIDFPDVSKAGFTALLGSREAAAIPVEDEIVQLALQAVYPEKKRRGVGSPYGMHYSRHYYGSSNDAETVEMRTPVEFLGRYYGLNKTDSRQQVEQIATKLESLSAKDDAASLKRLYDLCQATPETFVSVSETEIENIKKESRRPDEMKWLATVKDVVSIWKERQLDVDVSGFLIDFAGRKQFNAGYGGDVSTPVIATYLATMVERKGVPAASEFLGKLREEILGSEEEQAELATLLSDRKNIARNRRKLMPVAQYSGAVQGLLENRDAFFIAAKELKRFQIPGSGSNLEYRLNNHLQGFKPEETDACIAWLRSGKLLGSIGEFNPVMEKDQTGDSSSAWAESIVNLHYRMDDDLRANLQKKLKAKKGRSFGETLFIAAIGEDGASNIYDVASKHLGGFEKAKPEKQAELALFLSDVYTNQRNNSRLRTSKTDNGKKLKLICRRLLNSSVDSDLEKLLAARRVVDLGISAYELSNWSKELLGSIDSADNEKVISAIDKTMQLAASDPDALGNFNSRSVSSELLSAAMPDFDGNSLKLLLSVLENKSFTDFQINSDLERQIQSHLKTQFTEQLNKRRKGKKGAKYNAATVNAMAAVKDHLGDTLGDRSMNALVLQFHKFYGTISARDQKALSKWFTPDANVKYPSVYQSMNLAWQTRRAKLDANPKKEDPKHRLENMTDLQKEALAFATDADAPIQSRIPMASALAISDTSLPVAGLWACCDVFTDAIDDKYSIQNVPTELFDAVLEQQSDEGFVTSGGALAKQWADTKIANSRNRQYYSSSEDKPALRVVQILAKTENLPTLKKLLSSVSETSPAMLAALVESGLASEARSRSTTVWFSSGILSDLKRSNNVFSKQLEENLPKYLKLFKEDGQQLFAELFFASFADSKDKTDPKPAKSQKDRLVDLSSRFKETKFQSKRTRQLSLALLAQEPAAALVLRSEIGELTKDANLEQLIDSDSSATETRQALLKAYYGVEAQSGNFAPLQELLRTVNGIEKDGNVDRSNPFNDDWQTRSFIKDVSKSVTGSLSELVNEGSLAEIEKNLPMLSELNSPSLEYRVCPELNAMAHVATGKTDLLIKAWTENPPEDEDDYDSADMDEFLKQVKKMADKRGMTEPNQRAKLVTDIWNLGQQCHFNVGSGHYQSGVQETCSGCRKSKFGIDQLVDLKLLTEEQVLEIGPQLAEVNSVNGEVWRQVAKRQLAAEQFEQASESFRKALDGGTEKMTQANVNRRVEYANSLVKVGNEEEAKKMLKDVNQGQLFDKNRELLKELKTTLKLD